MSRYNSVEDLASIFNNTRRMQSYKLKDLLYRFNLKKKECERCGIVSWQNQPAPLELHHKDGDHYNNALANLKILCSNCHSLEPTFCRDKASRSTIDTDLLLSLNHQCFTYQELSYKLSIDGKGPTYYKMKKYCQDYGIKLKPKELKKLKEKTGTSSRRYKTEEEKKAKMIEVARNNERCEWPSDADLADLVWAISCVQIAKRLGVSSNAVSHRCTRRNIPVPPPGYWAKFSAKKTEECLRIRQEVTAKIAVAGNDPARS